jgi:DNA-binding NarL/FixJ family response regulator
MALNAIVFGKTLIVRQPVAQSLAALDFHVVESNEMSEVMTRLDSSAPSLIVMDADGMAREWRMLAAGLAARSDRPSFVLLTSRFSFDDAHQAMELRVAGVIVKPFRREEHTPRLLDLALRHKNLKARRSFPRFSVPEGTAAVLKAGDPGREESLAVQNFAEGGMKVSVETNDSVSAFAPGAFVPMALFSIGPVQVEIALDVVHRHDGTVGVKIARFFDNPHKFLRVLEERQTRALGGKGRKRKW